MPVLAILIALFMPRLLSLYVWWATEWFTGVFETQLWPILGFIFMPYTMLWYSVVHHWYGGAWGVLQIVVLFAAIIADISSNGSAAKSKE